MKAIRNLLVFMAIYTLQGTFVWILVMDKMSWREVMTFDMMLFIGTILSVFVTIAFAVEQDNKVTT